jgi:hypothetical protein
VTIFRSFLHLPQPLFRFSPLADIADHRGDAESVFRLHRTEADFDRHGGTVAAGNTLGTLANHRPSRSSVIRWLLFDVINHEDRHGALVHLQFQAELFFNSAEK